MNLAWSGPILAFTTFATIGIGHVLVRRLHPISGTLLGIPFMMLGLGVLMISFFVPSNLWSGFLGLLAITFFWDGLEFFRQEKRVQAGHG